MLSRHVVFSLAALSVLTLIGAEGRAEFSFTLEQYLSDRYATLSGSRANPKNVILNEPQNVLEDDIRPEFKLTTKSTRWVLRPRFLLQYKYWEEGVKPKTGEEDSSSNVTDAYVDVRWSNTFRTTTGLEVYQWGPAELYNASNPLYHLSADGRSAFYKEKGQALVRVSWDTTKNWNNMLILNPISNNEPAWRAEQRFYGNGFLKTEFRSKSGQSYLGLLGGNQPDGRNFFGEYACLTSDGGFSAYLDARHPIGTRVYVPEFDMTSNRYEMVELEDDTALKSLLISGVRYEGRVDMRLEYFFNSDGYSGNELDWALQSLTTGSPTLARNYSYFFKSGLELIGQHYVYASMRVPDVGWKSQGSFAIRGLVAAQDASSLLQLAAEQPVSDSVVLNFEGSTYLGQEDRELTLVERSAVTAGLKWTL